MTSELTEEEMRRALFGAEQAPAPHMPTTDPMAHIPDVVILRPPAPFGRKKKPSKNFTPRLRATLRVGSEFEGRTEEFQFESDTLSTLFAEQEARRRTS